MKITPLALMLCLLTGCIPSRSDAPKAYICNDAENARVAVETQTCQRTASTDPRLCFGKAIARICRVIGS